MAECGIGKPTPHPALSSNEEERVNGTVDTNNGSQVVFRTLTYVRATKCRPNGKAIR
jgi:hypothetical protein